MCFKREKDNILLKDRSVILLTAQEIDVLIALTKNIALINELKSLKNELKYMSPYNSSEIYVMDEKVRDKVFDIKIAMTKDRFEENRNYDYLLNDLKILIKEREAKEIK